MTTLSLSTDDASSCKVDALVIGVAAGPDGPVLVPGSEDIHKAMKGSLPAALAAVGATGKADQVTRIPTLGAVKAPQVVAVGLGKAAPAYPGEVLRRAAGTAVRALAGTGSVALLLGRLDEDAVRPVAEGALLGAYAFHAFRSPKADVKAPVEAVTLLVDKKSAKAAQTQLDRAEVVAKAVSLARDLVNTPPGHLPPTALAEAARSAMGKNVKVEVLDEKALTAGGFGGILGVGQGSVNPPRMVHLSYKGGRGAKKVALVGKGITFDSGGLSLKPPASMETMKSDMGGAAAVIAAVSAIAELGLKVDVEAWVPMAENMPSGTAIRPSDVLTLRGGTTIEVNNTDAEGRLVLADAIARACEDSPEILIDAATLTGAQLVALGNRVCGVMSNDDALRASVVDAAGRAGEDMWGMPLPPELKKGLDSLVADMKNSGPREGGMLTAGLFLQHFVADGVRWAHLDIAGPAYNTGEAYGYTPKGGTGAAVRAFVQVLEDLAG